MMSLRNATEQSSVTCERSVQYPTVLHDRAVRYPENPNQHRRLAPSQTRLSPSLIAKFSSPMGSGALTLNQLFVGCSGRLLPYAFDQRLGVSRQRRAYEIGQGQGDSLACLGQSHVFSRTVDDLTR